MKERPRALAVLISVFLLGAIIGSGGSYLWLRKSLNQERRDFRGQDFRRGPGPWGRSFKEMFDLSDDQERQFRQIMGESRKKINALRAEQWRELQPKLQPFLDNYQPKIQAIEDETNKRLKSVLNEKQRPIFDSFLKDMENNRRRGGPFGGRGMGPRPEGPQPPHPGPDENPAMTRRPAP